jgi:putative transposase
MPDHIHLLFEVGIDMTVEKAIQLIKGRFSFRLAKEHGYEGEVWQRGFSEVQVMDASGMERCLDYIAANPVNAGLVSSAEEYPFCYRHLAARKAATQGLKPT